MDTPVLDETVTDNHSALFSDEQILLALDSILSHEIFHNSPSVKKFLSYVVHECVQNDKPSLKGYAIAINAFGKPADFDPQDPYIRNIAREVRRALSRYYQLDSIENNLRIEIPIGSYVPKFYAVQKPSSAIALSIPERSVTVVDEKLEPTVAVIPFRGLIAGGMGNVYGELIANELIVKFSQSADFQVISLLSTLNLTDAKNVINRAKTDLAADYVIFGTYVESFGDLRVSMQVTEVRSQIVTHASVVNVKLKDFVSGSKDLSERLLNEIRGSIFDREYRRAIVDVPLNLESFTLKIAAIRLMHRISKEDLQQSKILLQALCDKNPKLAEPHALMGQWHILNHNQGWGSNSKSVAKNAQISAGRALEADEECSLALTVNAVVASNFYQDFETGESLFNKAIDSNPSNALAWLLKGTMHTFKGEGEQAVAHTKKAQGLSPLDPQKYYFESLRASAELAAGNYQCALKYAESSYKMNRHHASTLRVRTMLLSILGMSEDATESATELMSLMPEFTVSAYRDNSPVSRPELTDICVKALLDSGVPK